MRKNPKISVIMPAYNASKYVGRAIQSILDQSYGNFELLIADDGSTDKTRSVIDKFQDKRIKKFHNSKNRGKVYTNNKLLKEAKGDFITFQDADDFSDVERLETLLSAFLRDKELGMVGSNVIYCKPNGKPIRSSDYPLQYEKIIAGLPNHFHFTGASVMIRSEIVRKTGGYNEYFNKGGEDPYWVGVIALSEKFENMKAPLYYYRLTANSLSRSLSNSWQIICLDVVKELLKQRIETGMDDLERGDFQKLKDLEKKLIEQNKNNENWIIERSIYRDIQNGFLFRAHKKALYFFITSGFNRLALKKLLANYLSICKAMLKRRQNNRE